MLSKKSQSQKHKHRVTALDEVPAVKLLAGKAELGVPEAGAEGMGSLRDTEFRFYREKVLQLG